MLSRIQNEADKLKYISQMREIDEIICSQEYLPRQAKVTKEILIKLKKLYDSLELEIAKYEKLKEM